MNILNKDDQQAIWRHKGNMKQGHLSIRVAGQAEGRCED